MKEGNQTVYSYEVINTERNASQLRFFSGNSLRKQRNVTEKYFKASLLAVLNSYLVRFKTDDKKVFK